MKDIQGMWDLIETHDGHLITWITRLKTCRVCLFLSNLESQLRPSEMFTFPDPLPPRSLNKIPR